MTPPTTDQPLTEPAQQTGERAENKWQEYLRRNLIHAKAVGAHANTAAILRRLEMQSNPPKWLIKGLEGIMRRLQDVHPEIARWRDIAPDAPDYVGRDSNGAVP